MCCAARASLGMHFRLSRCGRRRHMRTETVHTASISRTTIASRGDPRFCPDFGCIQPFSGPHRFGTVVGSDSVAERIAPLLLMLTVESYNLIHPKANKKCATRLRLVPGSNLTPTAHQPVEPGWCAVAERIAPLLLMLTGRLYNRIHPKANKMTRVVPGSNLTPTAHQPVEPGWCAVVSGTSSTRCPATHRCPVLGTTS